MLDVNDETPTFFPAVYNVSVSEEVPREFRVVWLNCTDNDVGLNAELSYFITGVALPPRPSDEQPAWSGLGERGGGEEGIGPVLPISLLPLLGPQIFALDFSQGLCTWVPLVWLSCGAGGFCTYWMMQGGGVFLKFILEGGGASDSWGGALPPTPPHIRVTKQWLEECGLVLPRAPFTHDENFHLFRDK